MYMLVSSPKSKDQKEAFNALDEGFGTEEFTQGQAVNTIAVALEISEPQAGSMLTSLIRNNSVGEV